MATFVYPQISISTAGLATEAKQDAAIALLTTIDTDTSTIAAGVTGTLMLDSTGAAIGVDTSSIEGKTPSLGAAVIVASTPVNIASDQVVPVSVTSLPLPADAATQTTLAALLIELGLKADLTETQPVSAASLPLPTGAATQTTLAALLTELQLKADLTETQPVSASSLPLPTGAATQTTLAALLTELQLKADLTETQPVSAASLPLPTGAATQTTLAALLTELQLKADLTETQPVSLTTITPVDFLDSGIVDSSSTNIPAAGLTVVASLASACEEIEIIEDIGEFMTLTDGADVVLAYLPLGGGRVKVNIPSTTTLKLASISGSTISVGKISINFLG